MKSIKLHSTMKFLHSYIVLGAAILFLFNSCVHDDDYNAPETPFCTDMDASITIAELKAMYQGSPVKIDEDLVLEGYIVSDDKEGNVYKTLYIQDDPLDPTHGFTVSVDMADLYTRYPFGHKVFIKLQDLWLGEYGEVVQLGDMGYDEESGEYEFGRIPSVKVLQHLFPGCETFTISPKVVTMSAFNPDLVGALIQLDDVQIHEDFICEPFSYPEVTSNRTLVDCAGNQVLLRNSGFATFTNQTMPGGKGSLVAILSRFVNDYQLYVNNAEGMGGLTNPRCDGTVVDCTPPEPNATVQDIKDAYSGSLTEITDDLVIDAIVTANDESGNLYKLVYIEDETGGIRLRLNKTNLSYDPKYYVGSKIIVKAKDLYVDDVNDELQLGGLYNGGLGNIEEEEIYLHVFATDESATVVPTTISITDINASTVGKLITIEGVEFVDSDIDVSYAGSSSTNRTLEDCNENNLIVRTSNYASFAGETTPGGNGSITGILSVYQGTYQLYIRKTNDVDMANTRCDGTTPLATIFEDGFDSGLANWTIHNIEGPNQFWESTNFGQPAPSAFISGYDGGAVENEDWLVSPAIDLSAYTTASLSFDNVTRYEGNPIEVYWSLGFSGDVTDNSWNHLSPNLDTNSSSWSSWTSSGNIDISNAAGGVIYIAFKYTSDDISASSWEIDNVKVKAQ